MNDKDLDNLLEELSDHQAPPWLAQRIALATTDTRNSIDADLVTRSLNWLSESLWKPVLAASLPLAFGVLLGVSLPGDFFLQDPLQNDYAVSDDLFNVAELTDDFEEISDAQ
jgi:hypothetical protein